MQQYLPLAVLKHAVDAKITTAKEAIVATVLTACGIETAKGEMFIEAGYMLQQYLPLAVLKPT